MPRLLTMVVLPSFGLALVTRSTRGLSPLWRENRIEVSVVRNDSARIEAFLSHDTSSIVSPLPPFGNDPAPVERSPLLLNLSRNRDEAFRLPMGTAPSSDTPR